MVINSSDVSLSERHEGLFRDENCSLQQLILRPDQNAVVVALFSRRPAIFDISAAVVKSGLLPVNLQRDTIHGVSVALFYRIETCWECESRWEEGRCGKRCVKRC